MSLTSTFPQVNSLYYPSTSYLTPTYPTVLSSAVLSLELTILPNIPPIFKIDGEANCYSRYSMIVSETLFLALLCRGSSAQYKQNKKGKFNRVPLNKLILIVFTPIEI